MWGKNKSGIKYENTDKTNQAGIYASTALQSQMNILNSSIYNDVKLVINGGSQYIPELVCKKKDLKIFEKLEAELQSKVMINWSKHHKFENPDGMPTFDYVVQQLCIHFKVKSLHTRLNYYLPYDWKPFHHDSHAYSNNDKEDITIGASFGAGRELEFIHDESEIKFRFPQNNGDVFAFDSEVNKNFMHGVPKDPTCRDNRISIIVWGKKL